MSESTLLDPSGYGPPLPPHYKGCVGCGPEAPQGLHLVARRDRDEVVCHYVFDDRHCGSPSRVHGGILAAVADDVIGFLPRLGSFRAVTRQFTIDYLAPALLGVKYVMRARAVRQDGRKLWVGCEMRDPNDAVVLAASAVLIVVEQHSPNAAVVPETVGRSTRSHAQPTTEVDKEALMRFHPRLSKVSFESQEVRSIQ